MRARGLITPLIAVAGGLEFQMPPATDADRAFLKKCQESARRDEFGVPVMQFKNGSPDAERFMKLMAPIGIAPR